MRDNKIAAGLRFRGKSSRAADVTGMTECDPKADIGNYFIANLGVGCLGAGWWAPTPAGRLRTLLLPTSTFSCSPFFFLHPLWRERHRPPKDLQLFRASSRRRVLNC